MSEDDTKLDDCICRNMIYLKTGNNGGKVIISGICGIMRKNGQNEKLFRKAMTKGLMPF